MGRTKYWDGTKWVEIAPSAQEFDEHQADLASQDVNKGASLVGFSANEMTATNVREGILEAFMLGNSTKQDLVDKLLLLDDSLPIDYNSSWQDVLNSINQISTGKKWASGTVSSTGTRVTMYVDDGGTIFNQYYVEVSGLDFVPSAVIIQSTTVNSVTTVSPVAYSSNGTTKVLLTRVGGTPTLYRLQSPIHLNNGFLLPVLNGNASYRWYAYE